MVNYEHKSSHFNLAELNLEIALVRDELGQQHLQACFRYVSNLKCTTQLIAVHILALNQVKSHFKHLSALQDKTPKHTQTQTGMTVISIERATL